VGAVSVVALVLRFRRGGAVQRQQIKWFAYGAALSIPLGLFPEAEPGGPYLELLGAALQLVGLGIGIFRFRLWDIDRLVNRPWSTGSSPGGGVVVAALVGCRPGPWQTGPGRVPRGALSPARFAGARVPLAASVAWI
jgi:hypothetical protein